MQSAKSTDDLRSALRKYIEEALAEDMRMRFAVPVGYAVYGLWRSMTMDGAVSLAAIAEELNAREIEAPRGGRWYPASVAGLRQQHAANPS